MKSTWIVLSIGLLYYAQLPAQSVVIPHPIGDKVYQDTIPAKLYKELKNIIQARILQYRMIVNPNFKMWEVYNLGGHVISRKDPARVLFDPPLEGVYLLDIQIKKWRADNGYIRPHYYLIEKPQDNRMIREYPRDTIYPDLYDEYYKCDDRYLVYYNPDRDNGRMYLISGAFELAPFETRWLRVWMDNPISAKRLVTRRMVRFNPTPEEPWPAGEHFMDSITNSEKILSVLLQAHRIEWHWALSKSTQR